MFIIIKLKEVEIKYAQIKIMVEDVNECHITQEHARKNGNWEVKAKP